MPKCPDTPFDWPSHVRRKHRVDFSEGPLSSKRLFTVMGVGKNRGDKKLAVGEAEGFLISPHS